jgi:sugar phosphate isomerase/epimerase
MEGLRVSIALEFNWSPVVKSLPSAVRVAERVDHPRVGVLFDPAHYYVTPTKFEDLTAATVRHIAHVHLDDMRDRPGDLSHCNSDRVLPGKGVLDLQALIGKLEKHGYRGQFSIEMFNEDLWALPAAAAARQCYQSLLPLCRAG